MPAVQHETHEILTKARELLDKVQRGTAEGHILREIRRRPRAAGLFPDSRQLPPIGLPAAHGKISVSRVADASFWSLLVSTVPTLLKHANKPSSPVSSGQIAQSGCRRSPRLLSLCLINVSAVSLSYGLNPPILSCCCWVRQIHFDHVQLRGCLDKNFPELRPQGQNPVIWCKMPTECSVTLLGIAVEPYVFGEEVLECF
jgi:hypothetical protein